ncbi:MAG: glycoside hydrolase family 27 protein [Opitutales bacterium]|nr:glycoside hydrolase family 27 protein [Opitutales bacterium]
MLKKPFILIAILSALLCSSIHGAKEVAQTPPLGWNSFDAYDCRINEADFKANTDVFAKKLKEYGWEYVVLDYIWWHPEPGNWATERRWGHPNIRFKEDGEPLHPEYTTIDEYGRLLPAVERFPSSKDGEGFKPLADYVHSKGLKFGIHIMRGIHRNAYYYDLPIKGTKYTARDIAEPWDTCDWCNHMFGVDASKPGAQEYYNSLFELYASWGVDYVKVDDISARDYGEEEIQLIKNAIKNSGRPMVLSLSPGETPLAYANIVKEQANLWRISADFWDTWGALRHNFDLINAWSVHSGPGHWPDADMLPIGRLSLDNRPHGPERMTQFTEDEQYTLMNLWSIARSPLMIGADLLSSPQFTFDLLTNADLLEVNQKSENGRQIYRDFHQTEVIWLADIPDSEDKYFAIFNIGEVEKDISFDFELEHLRGKYQITDLWTKEDLGVAERSFTTRLRPHASAIYRMSVVKE